MVAIEAKYIGVRMFPKIQTPSTVYILWKATQNCVQGFRNSVFHAYCKPMDFRGPKIAKQGEKLFTMKYWRTH
jgi:hypothetical protein